MRKLVLAIIVVFFIASVFISCNMEEEIRVRIIPNSNSERDLKTKEEVKDIVMYYLNSIYDDDYNSYFSNINETYKELEGVLCTEFGDVSVSFDKHTLYNKTYNDKEVRNEEAYTLYVVLGSGSGDNWWGSIYPEFLSVGGDTEIKYESLLVNVLKIIKEN